MNNNKNKKSKHKPEWLKLLTKKELLGKGTYGSVFKYQNTESGKEFAVKRINLDNSSEGIPSTALREMTITSKLNHPNLIRLIDKSLEDEKILLCFEYFPCDLKSFMNKFQNHSEYNEDMIRTIFFQLLKGICYCHQRTILHRDLKPQNILIDNSNMIVKITDFGLARNFIFPIRPYTKEIATLWYRAPEIILGIEEYSTGVDSWSLGVILAELYLNRPLFMGESDIDQLFKIFQILGTPNPENFIHCLKLKNYSNNFPNWTENKLESYINSLNPKVKPSNLAIDLINQLLVYEPTNRISAKKALDHPYFEGLILPIELGSYKDADK